MHRITRTLGVLSLAASVTVSAACASDSGPHESEFTTDAGAATSEMTTTTRTPSSVAVPGPVGGNPVEIPAEAAHRWNQLGGPGGVLGAALGPATDVAGGSVTDFERGTIVLDPEGRAFVVQGEILTAYRNAGGPAGDLGFPTSDETTTDGGWISAFEGGAITFLDGKASIEGVPEG